MVAYSIYAYSKYAYSIAIHPGLASRSQLPILCSLQDAHHIDMTKPRSTMRIPEMAENSSKYRNNSKTARALWGELPAIALRCLKELTATYSFSVSSGELLYLKGRWYVTHTG